jgi:hypothetical protein
MKYYGLMICMIDGSIEDLECEADYKPTTEDAGWFGMAKWTKSIEEREKLRAYLQTTIKKYQEART